MSESYVLHDVMRKVKADGLFDSIRRDLISDIEQKPSYLDLKSQIESLMSSYLSEHKWSPSLRKSDIRERARRHIETSNLIKDTLPALVNQYMQTCQQQLIQPRVLSFVSDHIEHVYHSIGGTHVYRPPTTYTQSIPTPQEPIKTENKSILIPKELIPSKPKVSSTKTNSQPTNVIKKQIVPKKKPLLIAKDPVKEEKKSRILSPTQSPNDLIDISPLSTSIDNERTTISSSPSPPPPIVRIASPLSRSSNNETPRKIKRLSENNDDTSTSNIKKKKIKTDDNQQKNIPDEKSEDVISSITPVNETDSRKLRPRRPNPKYSNEQFETDDLNILELSSSPSSPPLSSTISKTKKVRQFKSSTSFEQEQFDTPSSPPSSSTSAPIETSFSVGNISPEYGTTSPSFTIEKQQIEINDEQSRTPSPVTTDTKKTTSPRRLRPRKANERFSTVENPNEKTIDLPVRTSSSSKIREGNRHRTEQTNLPSTSDDTDVQQPTMKKTRRPSSSGGDNSSNEFPTRSISVPDNLNITTATTDEISTTRLSPTPTTAPISKSFIWKPKISK